MAGLSLRGPNRLGASELDEGALTAAVVNAYAQTDGSDGAALAERVLPARRHLWRLLEVHAPQALAAALRARLLPADQTGRGGVRELRRAVADWLDPPPLCHRCHRPILPDTALVACPAAPARGVPLADRRGRGGRPPPPPRTCAPRPGPRGHVSRAGVARNGTLSLFSPVHLDPASAAAQKLLKHGGSTWYDLACDRDGRILFAASDLATRPTKGDGNVLIQTRQPPLQVLSDGSGEVGTNPLAVHADDRVPHRTGLSKLEAPVGRVSVARRREFTPQGNGQLEQGFLAGGVVHHACHTSTTHHGAQAIRRARADLERVIERAIRANGRLILGTQTKYFSPKGGVTRADLVQGGALGCRRALMDFDPRLARFSTYAINWIYQGIGEVFATRDIVPVPDWAASLRREVEARGIAPGLLLADIVAIAEVRRSPEALADHVLHIVNLFLNILEAPFKVRDGGALCDDRVQQGWDQGNEKLVSGAPRIKRKEVVFIAEAPASCGHGVCETLDVATTVAYFDAVHAWQDSTTQAVVLAANRLPGKAKAPITDEKAQEQVALVFAQTMNLTCTGGALITALSHGSARIAPLATTGDPEHDGEDAGTGGGDRAAAPSALRYGLGGVPDEATDDPEAVAAEEDAARQEHRLLLAALEALRTADPEAAEVVRRRHAMDRLGDAETLEEIAAAPLASTGRTLCRESVRKAYVRGTKALAAHVATGAAMPVREASAPRARNAASATTPQATTTADDTDTDADAFDDMPPVRVRRPHGPFRPRRPERVVTTYATATNANAPQVQDLGAWAAAMDAAAMAF